MALTVVAPMLFLVNFVAQDLHAGVYIGSLCWAGYGLGAMLGPPVYGYAADRLGAITALRWTFLVQTIGLIWLTRANNLPLVAALSVLIGTFISGMIPLMQACIRERIPDDIERQTKVWSKMVTTYVGALTIGAYVYSAVLNASNGAHRTLFALSILAVGLCLLIEFLPVASDSWSVVARNLQHRNRTQRKILQEHRTDS
jgi:MFS family permease